MAHEISRLFRVRKVSHRSSPSPARARLTVMSANASHAILVICTATTSSGNSINALLKSTKMDADGIPFFQLLLDDELKLLAGSFESTVSIETASELLLLCRASCGKWTTVVGGVAAELSEAGTLSRELEPSNESVGACEGGALLLALESYEGAREGRRY